MSWIKANKHALTGLSFAMYQANGLTETKMTFKVHDINGSGYCQHSNDIESNIDFEYELVNELPEKINT